MAEPSEPGAPVATRRLALRKRELAVAVAAMAVVIGVGAAVLGRGGSSQPVKIPGKAATAAHNSRFDGLAVSPTYPVPPLALDNYLGGPVNITDFHGKAVLVTFIYTHCPDTCPLMVSKLHTALARMPAAERSQLQIVAVSVDPRGDTRATVTHFLAGREMTGRMQYLIGSAGALGAVWSHWGIASKRAPNTPDLVEHTALIYGITARGRIAVVYPSNFSPDEIVHDARVLARA